MKMITIKNKTKTKFDSVDGKPNVQVDIDIVIGDYEITMIFYNDNNNNMSFEDLYANKLENNESKPVFSNVSCDICCFLSNVMERDLDRNAVDTLYHESPFKLTSRDQIKDLKKELLELIPVFKDELPEFCNGS